MFGKLLASVGFGSASVDARVPNRPVRPGEMLAGEVHLKGGSQDQQIKSIYMALVTNYQYEHDGKTHHQYYDLTRGHVADDLTIQAGETLVLPFEFEVPWETPVSTPSQRIYLRTGLDIAWAVDPSDEDEIKVLPDPLAEALLVEAENLGFHHTHHSGRCHRSKLNHGGVPFLQEFEFKPSGAFRGKLDEIEVSFIDVDPRGVTAMVQVDRRAGLFSEIFDMDERFVRLEIDRRGGYRQGTLENLIRQAMGR